MNRCVVTAAVTDCLALVFSLWAWLDHWELLCSFCCLVVCAGDLAFKADFHFNSKKLHLPSGSVWSTVILCGRYRNAAFNKKPVYVKVCPWMGVYHCWPLGEPGAGASSFRAADVIEVKKFSVARKRHIVPWNNLKTETCLCIIGFSGPH